MPLVDNDYQLMKALVGGFQPSEFTGPIKNEYLGPLMPDTEYVVLAFGIDGTMPTTDLYQKRFFSEKAITGTTEIVDIQLLKLFDTEEIIALDPSYRRKLGECECVAIVEATTNEPCDKLYFWWYEDWMKEGYTYEAFLEDLLMYPYANNPEIMDMYYSMDNGDLFFFAGIAEDAEGNVRQAVELEKAGCQIIRLTVPNKEAVRTLYAVKNAVSIPVVADKRIIHTSSISSNFYYSCIFQT